MNMNPATGDLQNVELSFKEIDDAVSFFRFKNKTDLANRLLGF